jgi:hypothetical protein
MAADKVTTRVVQSAYDGGKWIAQYYDAQIGNWFDIGDSKDTEQAARDNERDYRDRAALSEAERFFYDHAGNSYNPRIEIEAARRLAAAEQRMKDGPYFIAVTPDDVPWDGDVPYDGPLWIVGLYSVEGSTDSELIGSIGSVATETVSDPYIRVVAAELASENIK